MTTRFLPAMATPSRARFGCAALTAALLLGAATSLPVRAGELALMAGEGNSIETRGIRYRTDSWAERRWGGASVTLLGEAEAAVWRGKEPQEAGKNTNRNISEVGFKPVARLAPANSGSVRPFLEAGLGVHLISSTTINQVRTLSTAFQFGEIVGVGIEFCDKYACSVAVRQQHVSNAGIKQPNSGATFSDVTFGYKF